MGSKHLSELEHDGDPVPPGNKLQWRSPVPARVLVKAVNWLGDMVMSLPALKAVRRAAAEAHLAVLVRRDLASFFDAARWVDEVIPYRVGRGVKGLRDRLRVIAGIRARRFDLAILLPNSFDAALWPALAGVPVRAGFASDGRGWLLTHRAVLSAETRQRHHAHSFLQMLRDTVGINGLPADHCPEVSEPHRTKLRGWLDERRRRHGPLIALAPAAAFGPAKEWLAMHYAALVDLLAVRWGAECVLVGGSNDRQRCAAVAAASASGALVAAGETSVGELLALLSLCDGFAGNDSGPMHVAGAIGIPTVGLFGSTDPARTGPLGPKTSVLCRPIECSPCLRRTCRFGHYGCLTQIRPDEVVEALVNLGALGP